MSTHTCFASAPEAPLLISPAETDAIGQRVEPRAALLLPALPCVPASMSTPAR